jgi:hypothetical protein
MAKHQKQAQSLRPGDRIASHHFGLETPGTQKVVSMSVLDGQVSVTGPGNRTVKFTVGQLVTTHKR